MDDENLALKKEIVYLKQELKRKDGLLQEKNSELQNYLYTITHELKTPIISIRGYSTLLQDFHQHELNGEIKEYLERISNNADQIEKLINDLLKFVQININEDECETVDTKDIISEAVLEIQYMIKDKDMEIIIYDNLPEIVCYRVLLICVFTNLLSNAIKYSKKDKKLIIEIGYHSDEIFHKFFVKDNGLGIPSTKKDKLFKLFSRLHSSREIQGSGLGLAITKRIIEGHGGEIWVESAQGKGATFFFTLPRQGRI